MRARWISLRRGVLVGLGLAALAAVPLGVAGHTQAAFEATVRWAAGLVEAPLFSVEIRSAPLSEPIRDSGATLTAVSVPPDALEAIEPDRAPAPEEPAVAVGAADDLAALDDEGDLEPVGQDVFIIAPVPPGSVLPITNALSTPMFTTYLPMDERIFVVERAGFIKIIKNGMIRSPAFLDISARVSTAGEQGMLSMAFDPNFATNGLFYVFYNTNNPAGDTRISRFIVGSDPNVADFNSETVMLTIDQPATTNHKGGTIAFSPIDKLLYVGMGDGGGGNDPNALAQNGMSRLGKFLRLDVSGNMAVAAAGNPFLADPNVDDMIWSIGFRNPFRWSFDSANGDIWIGDVGQSAREEVDYEPVNSPGRNYGWDVREGNIATPAPNVPAPPPYINGPPGMNFVEPIHVYDHGAGKCSITGGSVHHGSVAELANEYLFADWCTGQMWSYLRSSNTLTERTNELLPASGQAQVIVGITEGAFKETYVVHLDGDLYRIGGTGSDCTTADGQDEDGDGVSNFPADPGCSSTADPSELDSDEPCDDGFDNDRDGAIDFPDDPGCTSPNSGDEGTLDPDCNDDIDNDMDGATDFPDDPGCLSATTGFEDRLDPDCDDDIDNDGDGRIDFPADPGCTSATTGFEALLDPDSGGGDCGLGFELIFVVPPLLWLRQRRLRG
jgi:hypothetical protein